jgi:hypothetical protein
MKKIGIFSDQQPTISATRAEEDQMKNQFRYLFLCFTLMLFSACATTEPFVSGDTGELVSQLEANLASAKSNQVDVLAPGLFNDAQSAFMEAKQGLEKGIELTAIQEYVAQGSASLEKAEEIAQVSRLFSARRTKPEIKPSRWEPTNSVILI